MGRVNKQKCEDIKQYQGNPKVKVTTILVCGDPLDTWKELEKPRKKDVTIEKF